MSTTAALSLSRGIVGDNHRPAARRSSASQIKLRSNKLGDRVTVTERNTLAHLAHTLFRSRVQRSVSFNY